MTTVTLCESCAETDIVTPATTRSTNQDWNGYALCQECADEYDSRPGGTMSELSPTLQTLKARTCPKCDHEFPSVGAAIVHYRKCCHEPGHISCSKCNPRLRRLARVAARFIAEDHESR